MLKEKIREMLAPFWKSTRVSPARVVIFAFLLLILLGTVLLMLPFSTREWGGASFTDALFTATSATCVTGLVVHDTATYWSQFGQLVILFLIQVGGMGVVTMAVAIFIFSGKRIGLKQRWVMQESISAPQVGGIVRMTGFCIPQQYSCPWKRSQICAFWAVTQLEELPLIQSSSPSIAALSCKRAPGTLGLLLDYLNLHSYLFHHSLLSQ